MTTLGVIQGKRTLVGDHTIGTIFDDSTIFVECGGLVVTGHVGNNVNITCHDSRTVVAADGAIWGGTHQSISGCIISINRDVGGTTNGEQVHPSTATNTSNIVGVAIHGNVGHHVTIESARGMEIKGHTGTYFTAMASSGDIMLQNCASRAIITTSSGDITACDIESAFIKASSGDIGLDTARKCAITTASGDITIQQAIDSTILSSSGDHYITDAHNTKLKATSGDIHVSKMDPTSAATTTSGDINITKKHPDATLHTISGSISISK